ncbi:Activator of stress proteins 1 [Elsinoe australis]|uniref:Activator of stress proteins 1 n=1 Tax=Elsinoe australis TaxID=40998 RepID=A0A2P7Z3U4_9PEZI|nr:Activator of stress proteins 1 [Elsinoe australis]
MEYKFVASGAKDLKRKRPHGACESCKKRKKRCYHGENGEDSEDISQLSHTDQALPEIPLFSPPVPLNNNLKDSRQEHAPPKEGYSINATTISPSSHRPAVPSRSSRFVGDTHAEANLELEQDDPSERRDRDGVGIWLDSADEEAADSDRSHNETTEANIIKGPLIRTENMRMLLSTFLARVQPLFPILEAAHTSVDEAVKMNETLALAVCLVAAKDERAKNHLRFAADSTVLPVAAFTKKIHRIIEARVRNWRSFDRLDLIRILTLISTHQEGAEGAEEASMHLSEAIHHAYTVGIHLKRHDAQKTGEDSSRLFWCIWTWDKLSAASNGRPRMAYEMDVGLDFEQSLKLFATPGRLWMKIARLLSSVNDLYNPRPCVDTESHIKDFPRWEFLLEEEDVKGMDEGFLTTLELFYHSVSMLSCRIKFLVGRKRAFASSLRRYLSAATVYSISKVVPAQDLAPLPVVPYAYCLATLVAYQQYRCSQRQVHRDIAEEKLAHFQEQLQAMSSCWYAAKSMARKSQRVLREFRRCNAIGTDKQSKGATTASGTSNTPYMSTVGSAQIPTPDSFIATKDMPAGQMMYDPGAGFNHVSNMGYGAFADMDMMFGNLMDMNAFTGDIEFALGPYMDNGYNTSTTQSMWPAGEGINGAS